MAKSGFARHEPCPRCGSRNNLARYNDGSAWCFGCRYMERAPNTLESRRPTLRVDTGTLGVVEPPDDLTTIIPTEPLAWLYSYELTNKEITENDYYYSRSASGLVRLYSDESGRLVGYEIRGFPKREPKTMLFGNKFEMSCGMLRNRDPSMYLCSSCVFVEDAISATKVNRHATCAALFGAHVSLELITEASKTFSSFLLWLDPDKRKDSVKQCLNLRQKGFNISPVFSDADPKELSDNDISSLLSFNGNLLRS